MADVKDYARQIRRLLPRGPAWREGDEVVQMMAPVCVAIDRNTQLLGENAIPSKADALLAEWERDWGLPDECAGAESSLSARQQMLTFRVKSNEIPSRAYFRKLVKNTGFVLVRLVQEQVFRVSDSRIGDRLNDKEMLFTYTFVVRGNGNYEQLLCLLKKYFPLNYRVILENDDAQG